jgi:hypothetical protein
MSRYPSKTVDLFLPVAPPRLLSWIQLNYEPIRRIILGNRRIEVPLRYGSEGMRTLRVNDTFFLSKDVKRFVVVSLRQAKLKDGTTAPFMMAVALSGDDKGSAMVENVSAGMYGSVIQRLPFPTPVFYGKQAKERYDKYVEYMTTNGNADLIVPFESAPYKPDPPEEAPPPSDTRTPEEADVVIRHTVQDGTVALWDHAADRNRPLDQSIYHVIRGAGFVRAHVSGGGEYRRTNSVGLVETRAPIHSMVESLHRRGFKVYLDLHTGETAEAIRRKQEYLHGRAERTEARAERKETEAERRLHGAAAAHEKEVTHQEIAGYFPTPTDLAEHVVELADIPPDAQVLEPSAGHGALVDALRRAEPSAVVDAVEINPDLRNLLRKKGVAVVAADILSESFAPGTLYSRIVMNPPFEDGQSIDHVKRAWEFLAPGGRLVAIVPESIEYRSDRKHTAFREWLDVHGFQREDVERQKFGRAADIKTRILIGDKSDDAPFVDGSESTLSTIQSTRADARRLRGEKATEAESTRDARWKRLRELRAAGRQDRLSRADAAELKALELADHADSIRARAGAIRRTAERVTATSVSKGGYGALKPERSTAPRRKHEERPGVLTDFKHLMRKIKGLTGAIKVENDTPDYTLNFVRWNLRFPSGPMLIVSLKRANGYGKEDRPPFSWDVMSIRQKYGDPPLAAGTVDVMDADQIFRAVVEAINEYRKNAP